MKAKIRVRLSDAQRAFVFSDAHVVGMAAGYGAGKSFASMLRLVTQSPERFPALVMANSYRQLVDVVAPTIQLVTGGRCEFRRGDMEIDLPQGTVYLRSSRTPDNWRGLNCRSGVVDEAAYAPRAGMEQFLARLRGGPWSYVTTPRKQDARGNPVWLYESIVLRGAEGKLPFSWAEFNATTESNPSIGKAYGETMRAILGDRLARQDVDGLWVDVGGGLCTWDELRAATGPMPTTIKRVVIGVDPAATTGETGIVVVGVDYAGIPWVVDDLSGRMTAAEWSKVVVDEWSEWRRRRVPVTVVAEINQGGTMVETTLRAVNASVQVETVRASEGKRARAEPVAALIRAGTVRFAADTCDRLLTQWAAWDPAETRESPDRLDAHVWAIAHLGLRERAPTRTTPGYVPGLNRPRRVT
jgi:phage terminase large subunit-like protein